MASNLSQGASRRAARKSSVLIRSEHPSGAYAVRCLRRLSTSYLRQMKAPGELSVLVSSDRAIARLNGEWRGKGKPTDVLSFPAVEDSGSLGDVVVSLDTARRQAREFGHPLSTELARLLAHGLLHLTGYDHITEPDARRMAKAEDRLLGRAGRGMVGSTLSSSHGHRIMRRTSTEATG